MRQRALNWIDGLRAAACPRIMGAYLRSRPGSHMGLQAYLFWRAWQFADGACVGARRLAERLLR